MYHTGVHRYRKENKTMTITELFNLSYAKNPDFYNTRIMLYIEADSESREISKKHWQKCHAANLALGREDMIIFTAKILAAIEIAEAIIAEQK